jgi:hypothetical protein
LEQLLDQSGKSDKSSIFSMNKKNKQNKKMSSSLEYFISGIKSEPSKELYLLLIKQFKDYSEVKDYDSLLLLKPVEIKKILESFVIHWINEGLAKYTINTKICAVKLFYEMNEIEIGVKRAIKMLPASKKQGR